MFEGWNRKSRSSRAELTWKDVHRALAKAKAQAKAHTHDRRHREAEKARGRVEGAQRAIAVMEKAEHGWFSYGDAVLELRRLAVEHQNRAHGGVTTSYYDHAAAADMLLWAARIVERQYTRTPQEVQRPDPRGRRAA